MSFVGHELVYEFILTAFFGSLGSKSHIHGLVFIVVVVDGTLFLPASISVFCEIQIERHKFRVQPGPIVTPTHRCKREAKIVMRTPSKSV